MLRLIILSLFLFFEAYAFEDYKIELFKAVREGNLEALKSFEKQGVDFSVENEEKQGLLHEAATYDQKESLEFLLKKKLPVDKRDLLQNTPLHEASWSGCDSCVHLLIQYGADINAQNVTGVSVLSKASYRGHKNIVHILIKHGVNIDAKDQIGRSPLHEASYKGNFGVVQALILEGLDPNLRDERGNTALYYSFQNASNKIHVDVFKYLVKNGADLFIQDPETKKSLYQLALSEKVDPEIRMFVLEHTKDHPKNHKETLQAKNKTFLHFASYEGDPNKLRDLLKDPSVEIDLKDKNGNTALHIASARGNKDVVSVLIEKGADINALALGSSGNTPLHEAIWHNKTDIAFLLLSQGADVHIKNKNANSLVHFASYKGNLRILKELVEKYQASVHVKDESRRSPLHDASFNNHLDVANYLMERGVKIDQADINGKTALHEAAEQEHSKIIRALVFQGASLLLKDKNGKNPLSEAFMNRNPDIKDFYLNQVKQQESMEKARYQAAGFIGPRRIIDILRGKRGR